jgi:hypothetical protein
MTTTQSFKVDLRKYKPGICVGFEKVIVECPLCGKGGYRVESSRGHGTWWVHVGTLSNGPDGLKWKRENVCRRAKLIGGELP